MKMAVNEEALKLIRFIVGTAREKGFNLLSTIHIVKYLYIADFFNAKSMGKSVTLWKWKFWDMGPWTLDSYQALKDATLRGFISSETKESKYQDFNLDESCEYQLFYCDSEELSEDELETLGREVLPNIRTRIAFQGIVGKSGRNQK